MKLKRLGVWLCTVALSCQLVPPGAFAQERTPSGSEVSIEELLSAGDYAQGEAIAIVRPDANLDVAGETSELAEVDARDVGAAVDGAAETASVVDDEVALRAQSSDAEGYVVRHVVDHSRTTEEILCELYADPDVVAAEPNYQISAAEATSELDAADKSAAQATAALALAAQDASSPSADLTHLQWYAGDETEQYTTPLSPTAGYSMNVPGWQDGRSSSEAQANASGTVCIMDTGVDLDHPDLRDIVYHFTPEQQAKYGCGEYGYNASGDDHAVVLKEPYFVGSHGTHVAGIVAAQWNDYGVSGVAHGVKLFSVSVFGGNGSTQSMDAVIKGFQFLADVAVEVNLKAVNCSWGDTQMHLVLAAMVNKLGAKGVNTVISSGNLKNDMDNTIDFGSSTNSPYAITVNAASANGKITDFSCYGQNATDVFAPGANIFSTIAQHVFIPYDEHDEKSAILFQAYYANYFPEATEASNILSQPAVERFDSDPAVRFFRESPIDKPESEIVFADAGIGANDRHAMAIDVNSLNKAKVKSERGNHGYMYLAIPVSSVENAKWVCVTHAMSNEFKPYGSLEAVVCTNGAGEPVELSSAEDRELENGWSSSAGSSVYQCQWSNMSFNIEAMRAAYNKVHSTESEQVQGVYIWKDGGKTYLIAKHALTADPDLVAKEGTKLYIDNVSVGNKDAYTGSYTYMSGTSMAAPATTGALMVVARDERPNSELTEDELATAALERKAKLLACVDYDEDLEKLCRTGGRLDFHGQSDLSKKAPLIVSAQDKASMLTVEGHFFGDEGTLYVDNEEVAAARWSDQSVVAALPELGNGSHVVKVRNADGVTMQASFSHSDEASAGLPLYENDLTLPTANVEFADQNLIRMPVAACGKYLFYITQNVSFEVQGLWCYDTQADTWSKRELPSDLKTNAVANQNMIAGLDGKLYLRGEDKTIPYGTENGNISTWCYDPGAQTWEKLNIKGPTGGSNLVTVGSKLFIARTPLDNAKLDKESKESALPSGSSTSGDEEDVRSYYGFYLIDPNTLTAKQVGGDILPYDVDFTMFAGSENKLYAYGNFETEVDGPQRDSPYGELYRFTYDSATNKMKRENLTSALVGASAKIVFNSKGKQAPIAIAGVPDGLAIVGSDTLGEDTHVIKDDATTAVAYTHTSCYRKAFDPGAVYLNGRLYATGYNSVEPEVMYFRSTNYDAPTPTPEPEPEPEADSSSNEEAASHVQMWRLYNPNSGEHFYTASAGERDLLIKAGWKDEGKAWKAPKASGTPVYRLYNPNGGDHHYTTSAGERDLLIKAGWKDEGIGWYSDDAEGVAVHRLYNPNAATGAHHFTTSAGERDLLVAAGWRYEGIGWYGVR